MAALVGASLWLVGCAATGSVQGPSADEVATIGAVASDTSTGSETSVDAELQVVLDDVAASFRAGSLDDLRPHLDDPDSTFGARWLERALDMRGLPFAQYELVLDTSFPDLATDRVRRRYDGADVQVRYVVEEHAIEGFDVNGPASEDLFLTFVRRDGGWRIASDRDAERLGLLSVDHLWDHGPVTVTGQGPIIALHHPGTAGLGEVLDEAETALGLVTQRWPLAWPESVPVLVPADQDELGELLHVTFDLSNFIAFATSTPTGELGSYELTGSRIMLNTPRFLGRSSATRQRILVHELLHVATRPWAGPFSPSWLEEGVAQAIGEQRATTGLGQLNALVASQRRIELPTDGQFTTGGRDGIFLSYQLGWSFVDHLVDEHGVEQVARFYAELGSRSGQPGTEAWHVDDAARTVFGAGLDDLVEGWRAGLR